MRRPPERSVVSSELKKAQERAKSTIESSWKEIAANYTAAWMGPIEVVEAHFPHVSGAISGVRRRISRTLPMIIYQSRESPPEKTNVAVPYEEGGDPYKCRLVATGQLTPGESRLLGDFAQAIWFSIDSGALPHPAEGEVFMKKLVAWTDEKLFRL
jgi:hypothetical protein